LAYQDKHQPGAAPATVFESNQHHETREEPQATASMTWEGDADEHQTVVFTQEPGDRPDDKIAAASSESKYQHRGGR
jgi:hypothetical protein